MTVVFIGIGSLGFYGIVFFSFLESLCPIPSLAIGAIMAICSDLYSFASLGINSINPEVSIYFSIGIMVLLPWVYLVVAYETNFKRYKAYLNEKEARYELIRMEELPSK